MSLLVEEGLGMMCAFCRFERDWMVGFISSFGGWDRVANEVHLPRNCE